MRLGQTRACSTWPVCSAEGIQASVPCHAEAFCLADSQVLVIQVSTSACESALPEAVKPSAVPCSKNIPAKQPVSVGIPFDNSVSSTSWTAKEPPVSRRSSSSLTENFALFPHEILVFGHKTVSQVTQGTALRQTVD